MLDRVNIVTRCILLILASFIVYYSSPLYLIPLYLYIFIYLYKTNKKYLIILFISLIFYYFEFISLFKISILISFLISIILSLPFNDKYFLLSKILGNKKALERIYKDRNKEEIKYINRLNKFNNINKINTYFKTEDILSISLFLLYLLIVIL